MVSEIKRLERKIERAAKTCIRLLAVCVIVVGAVVYFTFGTLSPCGILHEGIRQRDDFVAIFPDDIVEFGFGSTIRRDVEQSLLRYFAERTYSSDTIFKANIFAIGIVAGAPGIQEWPRTQKIKRPPSE